MSKLYLVAGEASGDSRGAELMRALHEFSPAISFAVASAASGLGAVASSEASAVATSRGKVRPAMKVRIPPVARVTSRMRGKVPPLPATARLKKKPRGR